MLTLKESWELPLGEVSAPALRHEGATGGAELIAVDDERFAVSLAPIGGESPRPWKHTTSRPPSPGPVATSVGGPTSRASLAGRQDRDLRRPGLVAAGAGRGPREHQRPGGRRSGAAACDQLEVTPHGPA